MRRLLITGGAGFIGANFVHYWTLHHPGDFIAVLDALTYAGNLATLERMGGRPNFKFVQGSILQRDVVQSLLTEHRLDTIVHFAAESHVDRSIVDDDAFIETNVVGTHKLLKAARDVWSQRPGGFENCRFHHVSTDEVYGSLGPSDAPFTEDSPPMGPIRRMPPARRHPITWYVRTTVRSACR